MVRLGSQVNVATSVACSGLSVCTPFSVSKGCHQVIILSVMQLPTGSDRVINQRQDTVNGEQNRDLK